MPVAASIVQNLAVAFTAAALIAIPTVAWLLDRRSARSDVAVEIEWRFTFDEGPDPVFIVAVTGRNPGRGTAEIVSWAVVLPDGATVASPLLLDPRSTDVPVVVPPGTERTWYAPVAPLEALLGLAGYPRDVPLRGIVSLPGGAEVTSRTSVALSDLRVMRRPRRVPRVPARTIAAGARRRSSSTVASSRSRLPQRV